MRQPKHVAYPLLRQSSPTCVRIDAPSPGRRRPARQNVQADNGHVATAYRLTRTGSRQSMRMSALMRPASRQCSLALSPRGFCENDKMRTRTAYSGTITSGCPLSSSARRTNPDAFFSRTKAMTNSAARVFFTLTPTAWGMDMKGSVITS